MSSEKAVKRELTFKVGNEVLCDVLPCFESLNEDVRGSQVGCGCIDSMSACLVMGSGQKESEREKLHTSGSLDQLRLSGSDGALARESRVS